MDKKTLAAIIILVLALAGTGYGLYSYHRTIKNIRAESQTEEEQLASIAAKSNDLEARVGTLETKNGNLEDALAGAEATNNSVSTTISQVASTVGTLQKLSQTDPELLEKYSKVYFLNENYVPASLTDIDSNFIYEDGKTIQIETSVEPFLEDLLNAAKTAGSTLYIASGYRSFGTQSTLKSSYDFTYGAGTANQFSAEQGYSEHQLGTAVDFTTASIKGGLDGFDSTPQYTWLLNNAYLYGFVISYPKGNGYYEFEPWHWRFVGKALALYLHDNNLYFYNVDQRQINTYLANIFDN